MTLKTAVITVVSVLLIGIYSGCKKDTHKILNCKISTAKFPLTNSVYTFTYNAQGKVSSISTGTNISTFTYAGDSVVMQTVNASNVVIDKLVTIVNADGLAISTKDTYNYGNNWTNTVYEYNGTQVTRATATSSTSGTPQITNYAWSNGNLQSATTAGFTTTYDYYTDRPRQNGDYLLLFQTVQGFECIRSKNLVKTINASINYEYEFGIDGNIKTLTSLQGNMTGVIEFGYLCN